jgi:hypothetical protein
MKVLTISVLAAFLALPVLGQGVPQPFVKSYSDISTEQAWDAAARAVRNMTVSRLEKKTDIAHSKIEFGRAYPGSIRGIAVRFKVSVSRTTDSKVQIMATATKVGVSRNPDRFSSLFKLTCDEFFVRDDPTSRRVVNAIRRHSKIPSHQYSSPVVGRRAFADGGFHWIAPFVFPLACFA